jgi:hypothetical protein
MRLGRPYSRMYLLPVYMHVCVCMYVCMCEYTRVSVFLDMYYVCVYDYVNMMNICMIFMRVCMHSHTCAQGTYLCADTNPTKVTRQAPNLMNTTTNTACKRFEARVLRLRSRQHAMLLVHSGCLTCYSMVMVVLVLSCEYELILRCIHEPRSAYMHMKKFRRACVQNSTLSYRHHLTTILKHAGTPATATVIPPPDNPVKLGCAGPADTRNLYGLNASACAATVTLTA